jgi:hypothetical protein
MESLFAAERTILVLLKFTGDVLAVLVCHIILPFAVTALQCDNLCSRLFLACHIIAPYKK